MSPRARVLVVTPECAAAPRAGGEIRTQRLLRALAQHAEVRVVVLERTDARVLKDATGVARVDVLAEGHGPVATRALAVLRGWPLSAARRWRREAVRIVREEAALGALVVLEHVYLDVYRPRSGNYVLSTQNVESEVHRSLPAAQGLRGRAERWWELSRLLALERAVRRRQRATVVVVSQQDAQGLRRPDAVVIENGADLPLDPPLRPRGGRILFVGSMTWPPNVEAVRWWLSAVCPLLPKGVPALSVVGRDGRGVFGADARLDVLDEVPDMAAVLEETSLVVVPLQHGGGTRLKILEALAWGRPVVSTAKGAEGLRALDGVHLRITDDAQTFADAVTQLYGDWEMAERFAAGGRELARTYDWHDIGERYASALLGSVT